MATDITNASTSSVILKVRVGSPGRTVAQVALTPDATRTVHLSPGPHHTVLKIGSEHYKGPGFEIPPNAARLQLRLELSAGTNLQRIDAGEFGRD